MSRDDRVAQDQRYRRSGSHRRQIVGVVLCVAVLAAAYICVPRRADVTKFDPTAMAQRETAMWRHYYEKRYFPLFGDLYDGSRTQYGFSPLDSVQLALAAARSAKSF